MGREFQAIILAAGKGSRMTELTASIAKCLLPVGNQPMIHYPLKMLERAGFKETLLIVPDVNEEEIRAALEDKYSLKIDFFAIPANSDLGTADSLRLAFKKIWTDVILISCDTITDFPLEKFINFHRVHNPTFSALIASSSITPSQGVVPGRKGKFKLENDLIGIDAKNHNRLVFLNSEADFEEEISFESSIFKQCQHIEMNSRYLDSHIYILKRSALKILNDKTSITSIKGELVPYLIRTQFKRFRSNLIERLASKQDSPATVNAGEQVQSKSSNLLEKLLNDDKIFKVLKKFSLTCIETERQAETVLQYPDSVLKCFAYILDNNYRISRANNLLAYVELNKQAKELNEALNTELTFVLETRAQISQDSIVERGCKLSERCSIRSSFLQSGCSVADRSRLTSSILMRDVQIGEGCVIQNCIFSQGAVIEERCELKNCIVGAGQVLKATTELSNEIVVDDEQMMEI